MVFVFVLLTVMVFLAVDYILRKEDRKMKEMEKSEKSPIFLSPEKALHKVGYEMNRLFHLSHTWVLPSDEGYVYVGMDKFMSSIFTGQIKVENLPLIGSFIPQGAPIWDVKLNGRHVSQLAPVSGEIIDINPACRMEIPLDTEQIEQSWVIKIKPAHLREESNNLMKYDQANMINTALRDELYLYAQRGHFLNDGGKLDSSFVKNMSNGDWLDLLQRFFPYQNE